MNCLIWEKLFTYFYNKFRSVNCMYCIKFGVNSSLLHKVCGTLDHFKESDILKIYLCVIFRETRHHAQAHVTPGALTHCPFFGCENTDGRGAGLILLASVCYGYFCWGLLLLFLFFFLLLPQNILLTSLAFAPDSESVSATRISLMASSQVLFIYFFFFSGHCSRPTMSALFRLLCVTGTVSEM